MPFTMDPPKPSNIFDFAAEKKEREKTSPTLPPRPSPGDYFTYYKVLKSIFSSGSKSTPFFGIVLKENTALLFNEQNVFILDKIPHNAQVVDPSTTLFPTEVRQNLFIARTVFQVLTS